MIIYVPFSVVEIFWLGVYLGIALVLQFVMIIYFFAEAWKKKRQKDTDLLNDFEKSSIRKFKKDLRRIK